MPANLENSVVATGLEKVSFRSNPKKGDAKEYSDYHIIALISHASKVMLKILQLQLQQYMSVNFQMFKLDLEKAEEPEIKLPSIGSLKSKRIPEKKCLLLFYWLSQSLCVDHNKLWKFLKRWEDQTNLAASWEICMQVKKQQLERHIEQWTGSKLGK